MLAEREIESLSVFVVSSTQLGAKEKDIVNAIQLMDGPRVRHYWDGDRRVGSAVSPLIDGLDIPAWDVWMLYKPGAVWRGDVPAPAWWEHQLSWLRGHEERFLDAERFAEKAASMAAAARLGSGEDE